MADLRNKAIKEAAAAAHAEFMRRNYPPSPPPLVPKCRCGLTHYEVPAMWAVSAKMSKTVPEGGIFCPACLPFDLFHIVAVEVANLSDNA